MNTVSYISDYTTIIEYTANVAEQIYAKLTEAYMEEVVTEEQIEEIGDGIETLLETIKNLNSQVVNLSAELDVIAGNSGDVYYNYEDEDDLRDDI